VQVVLYGEGLVFNFVRIVSSDGLVARRDGFVFNLVPVTESGVTLHSDLLSLTTVIRMFVHRSSDHEMSLCLQQ
jgi:hypothetical protein